MWELPKFRVGVCPTKQEGMGFGCWEGEPDLAELAQEVTLNGEADNLGSRSEG